LSRPNKQREREVERIKRFKEEEEEEEEETTYFSDHLSTSRRHDFPFVIEEK
jgi:hypothetical protein